MPKPPPRLRTGISPPSSSAACSSTRRAADSWKPAVPKICEPMWQCRPAKASEALCRMRATTAGASSRVKPNFWSSWAVARKSWVSACTPLLTRTSTCWVAPPRSAIAMSRSSSTSLSITIEPMPTATAFSSSTTLLLLPWKPEPRGIGSCGEGDGELAAGADVDGEPLVGDPAHDLGAQERLAGVVDAGLHAVRLDRGAEGREGAPRVRAHLFFVDDVQRRAVAVAQLRCGDSADVEHAVVVAMSGCRPHALGERVRVIRRQEPVRGERSGGGQLGPIVERVLRRDCCGRGPVSAGVPRQRCTHAPGGSQKSRAPHMPRPASVTPAYAHTPVSCREVSLTIAPSTSSSATTSSPVTAMLVSSTPAGMYCAMQIV